MNYWKVFTIILQILPLIEKCMESIEMALGAGNGAKKKEAIMAFVETLLTGSGTWVKELQDSAFVEMIKNGASAVIDAIVSAKNACGLFKKSKPA